jgi:hypothetical protein
MSLQLQYLLANEIARERTREAEAWARLRWAMDPEPVVARHVATRLAVVCRMAFGLTSETVTGGARGSKWHPRSCQTAVSKPDETAAKQPPGHRSGGLRRSCGTTIQSPVSVAARSVLYSMTGDERRPL